MTTLAFQSAIVVLLILLNGLFATSETALVSARKAGLRQRADAGDNGACSALELASSPNRFLSTVQIGISWIGVLSGAVGGAAIAEPLAGALSSTVPGLAPYAGAIAFGVVVGSITYLSLILGELAPKRLALNRAEAVASRVAGPMRSLSTLASPAACASVLPQNGLRTRAEDEMMSSHQYQRWLGNGCRDARCAGSRAPPG